MSFTFLALKISSPQCVVKNIAVPSDWLKVKEQMREIFSVFPFFPSLFTFEHTILYLQSI